MKNYVSTGAKRQRKPARKEVGQAFEECYELVKAGGEVDASCDVVRKKYSLTGIERGMVKRRVQVRLDTNKVDPADRGSGLLSLSRVSFGSFGDALKG